MFSAQAQKNAIGIRLGDNSGFGGEVSFQTALSKKNRIELDLGFRNQGNVYYGGYDNNYYNSKSYGHNDVKLVGIYQWVFDIKNGFKWYVGPGAGVGLYSSKDYYNNTTNLLETKTGAFGVIAGDVGIEYNFKFPLQLSFDVRPEIYLSSDYVDSFGPDLGLSARYRF